MSVWAEPSEARLRRLAWGAALLLAACGLVFGPTFSLSVLLGGALALVHFELILRLVEMVSKANPGRGAAVAVLGFGFRYVLSFLALYVIFTLWRLNVLAIVVGLSAPVVAVCAEWGLALRREFGSGRKS